MGEPVGLDVINPFDMMEDWMEVLKEQSPPEDARVVVFHSMSEVVGYF